MYRCKVHINPHYTTQQIGENSTKRESVTKLGLDWVPIPNVDGIHPLVYEDNGLPCHGGHKHWKSGYGLVLIQDLCLNILLDEASLNNGLSDSDCHLRRSQNSHNTTDDHQKFYARGFSATEEEVDGEQKERCKCLWPGQLRATVEAGHDPP
jgi:hypothetical protein